VITQRGERVDQKSHCCPKSEASPRIHVARPAISQTIIDLEEELGVRLLFRDRRTVRLTAAGEREAVDMLRRNQKAVRLTRRASLGENRIGSPTAKRWDDLLTPNMPSCYDLRTKSPT
jgi:DNA-binding transcriptional LysR family regulator